MAKYLDEFLTERVKARFATGTAFHQALLDLRDERGRPRFHASNQTVNNWLRGHARPESPTDVDAIVELLSLDPAERLLIYELPRRPRNQRHKRKRANAA